MEPKHTHESKDARVNPAKKSGDIKANLRYQRDKEREMVKGIFRFYEVPGGLMEFVFKKYKEDEVETYKFHDGQIYTIPLAVARHLNNGCAYPIHSYMQDENGAPVMKASQKVRRCGFQSLEFVDVDEGTGASIIEVTSL